MLRFLFLIFMLVACTKQDNDISQIKTTEEDLVLIGDSTNPLGYYKSSLVKNDKNITVWLHIPKSVKKQTDESERASELQIEIACENRKIKLLKAADEKGKDIDFIDDEKWRSPSPKNRLYPIIIELCKTS